jgi:DNA-binding XRE family transcriptional regulator
LDNWEFWSDRNSKDHIQFTAYKNRQKLKRAQEEEDYTQTEIHSVLEWSREEVQRAEAEYAANLIIDHANAWTSKSFYAKKLQEALQRKEHWEAILRPHLKAEVQDILAVD